MKLACIKLQALPLLTCFSMNRSRTQKVSRLSYCQYLLSSQTNYTLTNYAEHVEQLSHEM